WGWRRVRLLPDSRSVTAYHEAGHALAVLYFGIGIDFMTVVPHGFALGSVIGKKNTAGNLQDVERHTTVCMAGPIAEAHFQAKWPYRQRGVSRTYEPVFDDVGQCDIEHAQHLLDFITADPQQQAAIR